MSSAGRMIRLKARKQAGSSVSIATNAPGARPHERERIASPLDRGAAVQSSPEHRSIVSVRRYRHLPVISRTARTIAFHDISS